MHTALLFLKLLHFVTSLLAWHVTHPLIYEPGSASSGQMVTRSRMAAVIQHGPDGLNLFRNYVAFSVPHIDRVPVTYQTQTKFRNLNRGCGTEKVDK